MGTHPIFESDFDCLTDREFDRKNAWRAANFCRLTIKVPDERREKLKISLFLERVLMEHIELFCSSDFKLTLMSICSIRTPSRNGDIFEKSPDETDRREKSMHERKIDHILSHFDLSS